MFYKAMLWQDISDYTAKSQKPVIIQYYKILIFLQYSKFNLIETITALQQIYCILLKWNLLNNAVFVMWQSNTVKQSKFYNFFTIDQPCRNIVNKLKINVYKNNLNQWNDCKEFCLKRGTLRRR